MDTLSHALWGWVLLRPLGRRQGALGVAAGAAPDLLFFVPWKVETLARHGAQALEVEHTPGMWSAGGPPLPAALVEAYERYYVWSHSLVVWAALFAVLWLAGRRRWLWYALPIVFHIALDVPTHERYLTRPLHPLSDWEFVGRSWGDPWVWYPHLAVLVLSIAFVWRRYGSPWARRRSTSVSTQRSM